MLEKLINWIKRLFGIEQEDGTREPDRHSARYEDITGENITATISNKLANFVFADSIVNVEGEGKRAELVQGVIANLMRDAYWITAQVFGKGGKVIVPVVNGNKLAVKAIDQSRMDIRRMDGGKIMEATLVNTCTKQGNKVYYLLADYNVDGNGLQTIRYRAVNEAGEAAALSAITAWQNISDEITISNTDRALFAFLPCPRDNRRNEKKYGVPITYGAERDMQDLIDHLNTYRREYKLTRPMLGLDSSLWRRPDGEYRPVGIDDVKKTVQDGDDPFIPIDVSALDPKAPWMHFAPAIRYEAMEARYNMLCRQVEKACGLSQGILTERQQMNYANKDEVRAAMYDTFCVIKAMRDNWERAFEDIAYAVDVLAERFGLTPAGGRGTFEIQYDWDSSLIESTAEAFTQTMEGHAAGVISDAELRQWLRGGTLEEAQQALDEIRAGKSEIDPVSRILSQLTNTGSDEE